MKFLMLLVSTLMLSVSVQAESTCAVDQACTDAPACLKNGAQYGLKDGKCAVVTAQQSSQTDCTQINDATAATKSGDQGGATATGASKTESK